MRPGALKLIAFIDEIFPAEHDLAEFHVYARATCLALA